MICLKRIVEAVNRGGGNFNMSFDWTSSQHEFHCVDWRHKRRCQQLRHLSLTWEWALRDNTLNVSPLWLCKSCGPRRKMISVRERRSDSEVSGYMVELCYLGEAESYVFLMHPFSRWRNRTSDAGLASTFGSKTRGSVSPLLVQRLRGLPHSPSQWSSNYCWIEAIANGRNRGKGLNARCATLTCQPRSSHQENCRASSPDCVDQPFRTLTSAIDRLLRVASWLGTRTGHCSPIVATTTDP